MTVVMRIKLRKYLSTAILSVALSACALAVWYRSTRELHYSILRGLEPNILHIDVVGPPLTNNNWVVAPRDSGSATVVKCLDRSLQLSYECDALRIGTYQQTEDGGMIYTVPVDQVIVDSAPETVAISVAVGSNLDLIVEEHSYIRWSANAFVSSISGFDVIGGRDRNARISSRIGGLLDKVHQLDPTVLHPTIAVVTNRQQVLNSTGKQSRIISVVGDPSPTELDALAQDLVESLLAFHQRDSTGVSLFLAGAAEYIVSRTTGERSEEQTGLDEGMIRRTLTALARYRVRPVPLRATDKCNWGEVTPGLLCLLEHCLINASEAKHHVIAKQLPRLCLNADDFAEAMRSAKDVTDVQRILFGYVFESSIMNRTEDKPWFFDETTPVIYCDVPEAKGLSLVISGNQKGYLETCGCKARQLGGVARRESVLSEAMLGGALTMELGNLLASVSADAESAMEENQALVMLEANRHMTYSVIVPSKIDVASSAFSVIGHDFVQQPNFACANLEEMSSGESCRPHVDVTINGGNVRLIGWSSASIDQYAQVHPSSKFVLRHDKSRLLHSVASASPDSSIVLCGNISIEDCRDIARAAPDIDLIISSDYPSVTSAYQQLRAMHPGEKRPTFSVAINKTIIVLPQPGVESLVKLSVALGTPTAGVYASRIFIEDSILKTAHVDSVVASLDALAEQEYSQIDPSIYPPGSEFTGAEVCATCHPRHYQDWLVTEHSRAMNTLVKARRERNPTCVKCHVTGYGEPLGFANEKKRAHLQNVQCESCHGPGGAHVMSGGNSRTIVSQTEQRCTTCHDADHSEGFSRRFTDALRRMSHPFAK